MPQHFTNSFGQTYLTVEYDAARNWIYNDWQGLLSTDTVMQGSMGVLATLEATGCPHMLNDNRRVLGSWKQANDWIEREWMPRALQAGLRRFAHVLAPGIFGQASAEEMHLRLGSLFEMRLFDRLEDAQAWLLEADQPG